MTKKTCEYCGAEFPAKHPSARYCSGAHRQSAYRLRKDPSTGDPDRRRRPHARPGDTVEQIRRKADSIAPGEREAIRRDLRSAGLDPEPNPRLNENALALPKWNRVRRIKGYRKVIYSSSEHGPGADEVVLDILNAETKLSEKVYGEPPAYIEECDYPPHWHEARRRAFALIGRAADVLTLAHLYGVQDQESPYTRGAVRVLANPDRLLPRALVVNLQRERQTSDYRQRLMAARRYLSAALKADEDAKERQAFLEEEFLEALARLAAEATERITRIELVAGPRRAARQGEGVTLTYG